MTHSARWRLEPTESVRSSGIERESAGVARTELCEHAGKIRGHAAVPVHMRRAIHAILVFAKIIPFAPTRIRKYRMCLDDQLELFFIAALEHKVTSISDGRGGGLLCLDGV